MSTCPNCASSIPDDATFCTECGVAIDRTCPECGRSVPGNANFCPECRTELADVTPNASPRTAGGLRLQPHEFARRVEGKDLDGDGLWAWLSRKKEISIEEGNEALFLDEGKLVKRLGPGRHVLDSLMDQLAELRTSKDPSVVLVESRDTVVTLVEEVRTTTDYPISVQLDLVFTIDDPVEFVLSMLSDRGNVTERTFTRILGGSIRDELEATLAEYEHDELYGNRELKRDLRQDIESECRSTLQRNGLRLVELRSFSYEDDQDEIRDARKEVRIQEKREDIKDDESRLHRRHEERETDQKVHEERQRVRRRTAEQSADHEIETQELEQDHEKDDMQRRHSHKAEREKVELEEEKKTTRTERKAERKDLKHQHNQKVLEDLMEWKKRKDMDSLDVDEREAEIEMRREEHDVEVEKERLDARDSVDLETLASMEGVDESVAELAEMVKAADLTPEQLEALGAMDSDELARARQEAHNAEAERRRVEDQKEFREDLTDVAESTMDRVQETSESAMDNMGETGKAAAEDTSDNVIVSDAGSDDSGDTTIVQGGSSGGGESADSDTGERVACPECESEVAPTDQFCLNCGHDLGGD